MSHWAEIDETGLVLRVTVGSNEEPDEGYSWLIENLGGTWIQTSYNAKFRKNFAGVDYVYNKERDAFIPPRPFESWILDEETCNWVAPVNRPDAGNFVWVEQNLSWEEFNPAD